MKELIKCMVLWTGVGAATMIGIHLGEDAYVWASDKYDEYKAKKQAEKTESEESDVKDYVNV